MTTCPGSYTIMFSHTKGIGTERQVENQTGRKKCGAGGGITMVINPLEQSLYKNRWNQSFTIEGLPY